MLRAGSLRYRLELQTEARTDDSQGGVATSTWTTAAILWASIEALGAEERVEGEQLNARRAFRVRTRHRTDITTSKRFKLPDGRILRIASPAIDPDGRRREIEITCTEEPAE